LRVADSESAYRNQTLQHLNAYLWRLKTTRIGMEGSSFGVRNGTYDLYADNNRALWRLTDADSGNETYGVRSVTADGEQVAIPSAQVFEDNLTPLYERSLVYTLAATADTVERLDDSPGAAELSGAADELAVDRRQVSNAEFRMTVAADGQVLTVELSYEVGDADVRHTVTFDTNVTDPVEQPDWYETALNETGVAET